MDDGRWTMYDGRFTMDDVRWTMDDGRCTMYDGRCTMDELFQTFDNVDIALYAQECSAEDQQLCTPHQYRRVNLALRGQEQRNGSEQSRYQKRHPS